MASGLCAALTGRTHGCTDQACGVRKVLANSEPSTHGTSRRFAATHRLRRYRSHSGHAESVGSVSIRRD